MSTNPAQVIDPEDFIEVVDRQFSGDTETVAKKQAVVDGLRTKASIYHAAQAAGIARASYYRWYERDQEFAAACDDALEDAADIMETSTYEEALAGNALLKMFWLKAHRHKYRDKTLIDINVVQREIEERFVSEPGLMRQLPAMVAPESQQFQPISTNPQKDE